VWRQIIDCGNLNRRVAVDAWGNVYVLGGAGNIRVAGQQKFGGDDILLHKYSADGERLWTRQFGSSDDEYGNSIALDKDGNVFIGASGKGLFDGYQPVNEWDAFLIKNRVGETGVKAAPADIPVPPTTVAPTTVAPTTVAPTTTTTTTTTVAPVSIAVMQTTTTTTTTAAPVITPTTSSTNTTVTSTTVTIPVAIAQSTKEAPMVASPTITTSVGPQKLRVALTRSDIRISWEKPQWKVHHVVIFVDERPVKRMKTAAHSTKISRVKKGQHRFTVVFVDRQGNWFPTTTKMSLK